MPQNIIVDFVFCMFATSIIAVEYFKIIVPLTKKLKVKLEIQLPI